MSDRGAERGLRSPRLPTFNPTVSFCATISSPNRRGGAVAKARSNERVAEFVDGKGNENGRPPGKHQYRKLPEEGKRVTE